MVFDRYSSASRRAKLKNKGGTTIYASLLHAFDCLSALTSALQTVILETFRSRATLALRAPVATRRPISSSSTFYLRPL